MTKEHPCKSCVAPKRKPGCHAVCPDYIERSQEEEERKKARKVAMAAEEYFLLKSVDNQRRALFILKNRKR